MFEQGPGASNIRTPAIEQKTCPQCGAEIEMSSSDMQMDCPKCGVMYSMVQVRQGMRWRKSI